MILLRVFLFTGNHTDTSPSVAMTDATATSSSLRSFHLRVLFPHLLSLPKNDPRRVNAPPPITRSASIDSELYTYLALLVRDFIHPWYRAVTNDHDFCVELVRILTRVIQQLETRLCDQVDWTELILISAPNLLSLHYNDYRQAKTRLSMSHAGSSVSIETLFHGMQPHFALQAHNQQQQEAEYLRALTDNILKILLSKEDYDSDCVRHLVRELLSNLVLGNIIELLADPYTIHLIVCKLLEGYAANVRHLETTGVFESAQHTSHDRPPPPASHKLASALHEAQTTDISPETVESPKEIHTNDKSFPSQLQRLQEKRRLEGDDMVDAGRGELDAQEHKRRHFSFGYITLQVISSPIQTLWLYLVTALTQSQTRYLQVAQHTKRTRHSRLLEPWMHFLRIAFLIDDQPVLQWIWCMIAMFVWPLLRIVGVGLLVDKFLEQTILHFLSEDHLVFYLQQGRNLLWPDGTFLTKSTPPTIAEQEETRIQAERLLTIALPRSISNRLFDTDDLNKVQMHIHEALEPLQNKYINKHLLFLLVDLIASKLLPELVDDP